MLIKYPNSLAVARLIYIHYNDNDNNYRYHMAENVFPVHALDVLGIGLKCYQIKPFLSHRLRLAS